MSASATHPTQRLKPKPRQAIAAKVFHWVNLVSLVVMLGSGLQIYNSTPVFGGKDGWDFPKFLLIGGGLAAGRDWHFASMWFYSLNLLWYGVYVLLSRRWRHRFAHTQDWKALKSQNQKRRNYTWHRLAYTAIVPILVLAIFSGLAMYKPVQFAWLFSLFRDWHTLRIIHFLTVPIAFGFTLLHFGLSLAVGKWRLVRSMFF
ncbi:MAG: cytochrome b/b6 domain-containing protein [Cyanobacteria bacterium P01_H01_bin.121]